jgi:hypothetical protein
MGNPMPLFERYAAGTTWVLSVDVGEHKVGTIVRVVKEPLTYGGEDELVCTVTDVKTEESFVCDLEVLA